MLYKVSKNTMETLNYSADFSVFYLCINNLSQKVYMLHTSSNLHFPNFFPRLKTLNTDIFMGERGGDYLRAISEFFCISNFQHSVSEPTELCVHQGTASGLEF